MNLSLDLSKMCTDEVFSLKLSGNSILQTRGDWESIRQYEMVIAQSPSELAWNTLRNMVGALLTSVAENHVYIKYI